MEDKEKLTDIDSVSKVSNNSSPHIQARNVQKIDSKLLLPVLKTKKNKRN